MCAVECFYIALGGLATLVSGWMWLEDAKIGRPYNRVRGLHVTVPALSCVVGARQVHWFDNEESSGPDTGAGAEETDEPTTEPSSHRRSFLA